MPASLVRREGTTGASHRARGSRSKPWPIWVLFFGIVAIALLILLGCILREKRKRNELGWWDRWRGRIRRLTPGGKKKEKGKEKKDASAESSPDLEKSELPADSAFRQEMHAENLPELLGHPVTVDAGPFELPADSLVIEAGPGVRSVKSSSSLVMQPNARQITSPYIEISPTSPKTLEPPPQLMQFSFPQMQTPTESFPPLQTFHNKHLRPQGQPIRAHSVDLTSEMFSLNGKTKISTTPAGQRWSTLQRTDSANTPTGSPMGRKRSKSATLASPITGDVDAMHERLEAIMQEKEKLERAIQLSRKPSTPPSPLSR